MEELVDVEVGDSGRFEKVDDPVENEFGKPEKNVPRDNPNESRMNHAMRRQTMDPELFGKLDVVGNTLVRIRREPMVLSNGEKFPLERVVGQEMPDRQCE